MSGSRSRTHREPTGAAASGLRAADVVWGLVTLSIVGYLLVRTFVLGGDPPPQLSLGPVHLSIFGILTALGLVFSFYLLKRWCDRFALDWQGLADDLPWIIVVGLYISHLVSVAVYFPEDLGNLRALLDPRTQLSSFGTIFGGLLLFAIALRRRGHPFWRYGDALAFSFVGGYILGRAGCFAIHDHPGVETDFFLAVQIDGVRRHDLGLYEMFAAIAIFLCIALLARKRRPLDGIALGLAMTLYAPIRFYFDSLRIKDVTYAGLTPGQWFTIPLLLTGLYCFWRQAGLRSGRRVDSDRT